MILLELYEREKESYQDIGQDNSRPKLGDLRKTKLTLAQINKLRKLNDVRAVEFKEKMAKVKAQYAPPVQPMM